MNDASSARSIAILDARPGSGATPIALLLWARASGSGHAIVDLDPLGFPDTLQNTFSLVQADRQPLEGPGQAVISDACLGCGSCALLCRFGAIQRTRVIGNTRSHGTPWHVDPLNCLGCGVCARFCPSNAIFMSRPSVGTLQISCRQGSGTTAVSMLLEPGRDLTPGVVSRAIREAKNRREGNDSTLFVTGIAATSPCAPNVCAEAETLIFAISPVPGAERFLERAAQVASITGKRAYVLMTDSDRNSGRSRELEAYSRVIQLEPIGSLPYSGDWRTVDTPGTNAESMLSHPGLASLEDNVLTILLKL